MAAVTKAAAGTETAAGAPMATTTRKATKKQPEKSLTLQQKFVKLRKAIPAIVQRKHSEGVQYKFAKIFDVYELLTPAMNEFGVNFDIVAEKPTRHAENGDQIYYTTFQQNTTRGARIVWVYEADLTIRWTNADSPEDVLEVTLHAIGTNDGGPDKAKGSAWTYCLKYYLFEKFGIDQGEDDPDMADHGSDAVPLTQNKAAEPKKDTGGRTASPPPQNGQNEPTGAQKPLTEAQLSRMYRKGEDAGWTDAQVNAGIAQKYGQKDPHFLTRVQYDEVCNLLDAEKRKEQGGTQNA